MKRFFDIVVSFTLFLAFMPLMLLIALAIKSSSKGPILFLQQRLGLDDQPFTIYKFRTMYPGSEIDIAARKNDPRVTPIGRLLRPIRFDEFPQLLNILQGTMSLVGPRPRRSEQTIELAIAIPNFYDRLQVMPGLTGLAQVTEGCDDTIESHHKKFSLDMQYIREQSLLLDLKILFRTVGTVFARMGT